MVEKSIQDASTSSTGLLPSVKPAGRRPTSIAQRSLRVQAMTDDIAELAARVEAATGPDRDLDGWIAVLLDPGKLTIVDHEPGRFPRKPIYGPISRIMETIGGKDGADYISAPAYTASLDAAMTLVPEGFSWSLYDIVGKRESVRMFDDVVDVLVNAQSPALALTAAALRARSHLQQQRGDVA